MMKILRRLGWPLRLKGPRWKDHGHHVSNNHRSSYTDWFKMVELPVISQLIEKDENKSVKWTIDKLSDEVARLFNQ